jgi:hypothetical protein
LEIIIILWLKSTEICGICFAQGTKTGTGKPGEALAFSFSGCRFYCRFWFPFLAAALRLETPSWYKLVDSSAVGGQAYRLDHSAAPLFDKRIVPFFHQTLRIPASILITHHCSLITAHRPHHCCYLAVNSCCYSLLF